MATGKRPYFSSSIADLESLYADQPGNIELLASILFELKHRKSKRAKELHDVIEKYFKIKKIEMIIDEKPTKVKYERLSLLESPVPANPAPCSSPIAVKPANPPKTSQSETADNDDTSQPDPLNIIWV